MLYTPAISEKKLTKFYVYISCLACILRFNERKLEFDVPIHVIHYNIL